MALGGQDDFGAHDPYALVGEVVAGRFRVLGLRHTGPRGLVYEVEPPGVGHMRRALKVLTLPEAREPDVPERLRTIVRGLREVDGTYVERTYDVGILPDDTPFVVTEWLPLPTLETRMVTTTRLSGPTAFALLTRIVQAVAALHARGVTHGDLRPAHVLVEMLGDKPDSIATLKVVDAGIPAVVNGAPSGGPRGAVAYLAPECIAGHGRSPASDVYALGVIAYRLLTHLLPYRPDDPRAAGQDPDPSARVRWLHQNASPVRPSRLIEWADFSPALEAVVGRAMAKSVAERHPNAQALLDALEEALAAPRAPAVQVAPASNVAAVSELSRAEVAATQSAPRPDARHVTTASNVPLPASTSEPRRAPERTTPMWAWALGGLLVGAALALVTR